ncbi:MAG TPA: ISL3 family transposase [Lachnospiraceae bacterium]
MKGVNVKKIVHSNSFVKIFLETVPREHICPACFSSTKRVHDYRTQVIKDLPFQLKHCYLVLRKRRYVCLCGKRFYENYSFLPRYFQHTSRLTAFIAASLHDTLAVSGIAAKCNVSTTTVNRILDTVSCTRTTLSTTISIDEFKGNSGHEKYHCILVDPSKHSVLDILPSRSWVSLSSYFRDIPRNERYRVNFFVCDMWRPYADLAKAYFPNASIIIDKYHFIRQVSWAIEAIRKRLQKTMPAALRKYYKRSRSLILHRYDKLTSENKKACDLMLLYKDELRQAHYLKEYFFRICKNPRYSEQRKEFFDWICTAEQSQLKEFEACAKTFRSWRKEILNAFKYPHLTNGPTEGFNNKIKVLKRISYGFRNFEHFRTRILLTTQ